MKKLLGVFVLTAVLALGMSPFSYGGEPDRNLEAEPKVVAPGPAPNPPVSRQYPPGCSSHATVVELLKVKYREIPLIIGVTKKNYLFEVFGNSLEDGTFSVVLTNTEGISCIVDTGTQLNFVLKMVPAMSAEGQSYQP
jgi:hypothetical protein